MALLEVGTTATTFESRVQQLRNDTPDLTKKYTTVRMDVESFLVEKLESTRRVFLLQAQLAHHFDTDIKDLNEGVRLLKRALDAENLVQLQDVVRAYTKAKHCGFADLLPASACSSSPLCSGRRLVRTLSAHEGPSNVDGRCITWGCVRPSGHPGRCVNQYCEETALSTVKFYRMVHYGCADLDCG